MRSKVAMLNIKTDVETKQALKDFADEIGITSTALVNMLLRQALRDKKIVIDTGLRPTPYLTELIKDADKELEEGKVTFMEPNDFLAHLDELKGGK